MSRPSFLGVLGVAVLFAGLALGNECLVRFGVLADGADPKPLVLETFKQLLQDLGGTLKPETLDKMAKSEDPFVVPEQEGVDLGALRKSLDRLKAMVAEKQWDTPELRSAVRDLIAGRGAGAVEQEEAIEKAVAGIPVRTISLATSNEASLPEDARYIVTPKSTYGIAKRAPFIVSVYDTATGEVTEAETGKGYQLGPKFSPNGDALLLFKEGGVVSWVPFANGKPDPANARTLGSPDRKASNVASKVGFLDNGSFFASDGVENLYVFNPKTGKRVRVDLQRYAGKDRAPVDWGVYDGKRIWVAVRGLSLDPLEYHVVSVTSEGKVRNSGPASLHIRPGWPRAPLYASNVAWADGGKRLLISPAGAEAEVRSWTEAEKKMGTFRSPRGSAKNLLIRGMVSHPSGNEVAVLFQERGTEKSWVEVLDPATLERKHVIDLPDATFQIDFRAGGTKLIGLSSQEKISVVDYPAE